MELKFEILQCIDSLGRFRHEKVPKYLLQFCQKNNVTTKEYFYLVKYGYSEYPDCKYCGKRVEHFWTRKNHFYLKILIFLFINIYKLL